MHPHHLGPCINGDGYILMHAENNAILDADKLLVQLCPHGIYASTSGQPLMLDNPHFVAMAENLLHRQQKMLMDRAEHIGNKIPIDYVISLQAQVDGRRELIAKLQEKYRATTIDSSP